MLFEDCRLQCHPAREATEAAEHSDQEAMEATNSRAADHTLYLYLEVALGKRLTKEAQDIQELEDMLTRRKQSLREELQSMPAEILARLSLSDETQGAADTTNNSKSITDICMVMEWLQLVVRRDRTCCCSWF